MTLIRNRIVLVVLGATGLCGLTRAQDASPIVSPARGFNPDGVYATGNIDSIDMASGTVTFTVPLVSLPPAPGGLSGGALKLYYSSKIWQSNPDLNTDPQHPKYYLMPAAGQGGWRYGFDYQLEWGTSDVFDTTPCNQLPLRVIFPDGSRHPLHAGSSCRSAGST